MCARCSFSLPMAKMIMLSVAALFVAEGTEAGPMNCGDQGSGVSRQHATELGQIVNITHQICDGIFGREKFENALQAALQGGDKDLLTMICNHDPPSPKGETLEAPLTNVCAQYFGVLSALPAWKECHEKMREKDVNYRMAMEINRCPQAAARRQQTTGIVVPHARGTPNAKPQQIVCSSDSFWPDKQNTFICYWAAREDGEFNFNINGLQVDDLLKLRSCPTAPSKDERSGAKATKYWASCTALFAVEDPTEKCAAKCLASYCADCDDGQTLYQVYAARLCLNARRCKNSQVTLNIPKSRVNEEHCAVRVLNDVSDEVDPGKICLPWEDECAGDWFDCIANSDEANEVWKSVLV